VAIRRCPYCKAIIDESQKYCNNCGTQLLFPEDEEGADEDTKGEKILDDDEGTSSEEEFEASLEKPPDEEAEAELEKEEIDLEEALQGGGTFPGEEPAAPPEVEDWGQIKVDEDASAAEVEEAPLEEGVVKSAEEVLGDLSGASLGLVHKPAAEEAVEKDRPAANGLDFEAKGEIVQLLAELEKRKAESPETTPAASGSTPGSEDLPPWAELVKEGAGAVSTGIEEEPDEELSEEKAEELAEEAKESPDGAAGEPAPSSSGFAPGDTMDFEKDVLRRVERLRPESSTMGIPESVVKVETPSPVITPAEEKAVEKPRFLPGEEDLDENEAEEELGLDLDVLKDESLGEEGAVEEEVEAEPAAAGEPAYVPPQKLGFLGSLKAFLFDTVFVALFWFIAVGLAARLMKVGLFALVREASLSLGILFLALWGGYFFLFLFFLGETLGRRLASARD